MIIHQAEAKRENGLHEVSARIEFGSREDMPERMWFRVREELAPHISTRADIFTSSVVRLARILGEDIEVRGELSPQLFHGLREYVKLHDMWANKKDGIKIKPLKLRPSERAKGAAGVSCNISGGIDSFHTLWSQLPENEPAEGLQVKYGIFGDGLSSPDRSEYLSTTYLPRLEKLLETLGVELWAVESNLANFGLPKDRWLAMSTGRIALPQLFSPTIGIHYSPSSITYKTLRSWGASPLSDHMFSMETLRVFTHTPHLMRYEKLQEIVDWPPLWDHLQVCNAKRGEILNDSTCNKCVRTNLMLHMLDVEEKFSVFAVPFKSRMVIRRMITASNQYTEFKIMARQALMRGKIGLAAFMLVPMLLYKVVELVKPLYGHKFK